MKERPDARRCCGHNDPQLPLPLGSFYQFVLQIIFAMVAIVHQHGGYRQNLTGTFTPFGRNLGNLESCEINRELSGKNGSQLAKGYTIG